MLDGKTYKIKNIEARNDILIYLTNLIKNS